MLLAEVFAVFLPYFKSFLAVSAMPHQGIVNQGMMIIVTSLCFAAIRRLLC